jgi:hypothetical protein
VHDVLRLSVIGNRHREVHVLREPGAARVATANPPMIAHLAPIAPKSVAARLSTSSRPVIA